MSSGWLQSLMFDWMQLLEAKLVADGQETGKNSPWGKESDIEPFLRLLSPDKLALITIVEMLRLGGSGGVSDGVKAARGILHVGKAIENEYHAELLKGAGSNKAFEKEMERVAESGMGEGGMEPSWNQEKTLSIMWRRELAKREKEGDNSWRPAWSQGIRAKVGSILLTALMEVAKVQRSAVDPITGETQ
jgi:DNA-directed RNA polymerase